MFSKVIVRIVFGHNKIVFIRRPIVQHQGNFQFGKSLSFTRKSLIFSTFKNSISFGKSVFRVHYYDTK